jgi:hypothetical protein
MISFDAEHGHGDFAITDNQAFCAPTSQNQRLSPHAFHFRDNSLQKRHPTYNRSDRSLPQY